jgi:hypothetical protein
MLLSFFSGDWPHELSPARSEAPTSELLQFSQAFDGIPIRMGFGCWVFLASICFFIASLI